MKNPISDEARSWLYVIGITIGIFGVVAGPLMSALQVPDPWVAVVVSFLGAIATATNTLARANVDTSGVAPVDVDVFDVDADADADPVGALTD